MPPIASLLGGQGSAPQINVDAINWSGSLAANAQSILGEALLHDGLVLPGEISALAVDPVQGLLAVGTSAGTVHLFGSPAVQLAWTLKPALPVQYLLFKPGTPLLVCADGKGNLSIYDLSRPDPAAQVSSQASSLPTSRRMSHSQSGIGGHQPHPDTPTRVAAHVARNTITCLHISPSHSHLLLGLRDGTVDAYDLDRLAPAPFRIPNCWYEEEELLRKSQAIDAPSRRHVPLIVDMAHSPQDLNTLLLAYEGGAVLLNIKELSVIASFSLRLLPGAPGAGGISPDAIWSERGSPVTCVAWRPDGLVLALGHEDGLVSFWSPGDDSKPLLVRSLTELDLDKPTVEELGPRPAREPIFKLAWAGFSGKSWLESFSATADSNEAQGSSTSDMGSGSTILTILGGAVAGQDPPGVATITFAPFSSAIVGQTFWGPKERTPDIVNKTRQSLRASLNPTREGRILSSGVVQDFVLLPRSSPHYSMAWDPVAIIMLTDIPHGLPPLAPPSAQRGVMAAAFPPLPPPGTRSRPSSTIPTAMELSKSAAGPTAALPADFSAPHLFSLPFALACSGAGAIIGAQIVTVPLATYRKLVGPYAGSHATHGDDGEAAASHDSAHPPLPLRGGLAAARVSDDRAFHTLTKTSGLFQLMISHHLDGSIRFSDISSHLLLAPKAGLSLQKMPSDSTQSGNPPPSRIQFLDQTYPLPLPHLTIKLPQTLLHPSYQGHPRLSRFVNNREGLRISSIQFALETLELSVVLWGGLLVHYRYGQARFSQSDAVEADVQAEVQREREGAEQSAYVALGTRMDRTSISGQPSSHQQRESELQQLHDRDDKEVGERLEGDMRRALRDLDSPRSQSPAPGSSSFPTSSSTSTLGTPPPRPKRDPNRGGVLRRFRRQGEEEGSNPTPVPQESAGLDNATQLDLPEAGDEFTNLDDANDWSEDGFKANLLIALGRGEITQVAHSDIGFLAIACGAGLAIVDLRGPEILLREGLGDDFSIAAPSAKGKEGRSAKKLLEAESKAPITSLAWTICRLPGAKPINHTVLAPRLVVGRSNGLVTVWTLIQALSMWLPERTGAIKVDELDYESSRPSQLSPRCFLQVLDVAGNAAAAAPVELQRAIREQGRSLGREEDTLLSDVPLLFGWSDRSLFLRSGLLGPRVAKADTSEAILRAALVERGTEKIAVAVSKTSIRIYSTPGLELVQRIQRHGHDFGEQTTTQQSVFIDRGPSGVFLEVLSSLDARLWTFFAQAPRPIAPSLLLHAPKTMPAHPGAGAVSAVASWFSTKAATTSSLDDVFAGPHRPEAPRLPPVKTKDTFAADLAGEDLTPKPAASGSTPLSPSADGRARGAAARHHATAATVAQTQGARDQMGWNLDLARRRGEAMAGLENSLASLEKSTSDWVKESKSALIKSAAKDKLSKFGF